MPPTSRLPPPRAPQLTDPAIPPGERIPGSTISVPHTVAAGSVLRGRVPVGSQVEIDGKAVAMDGSGRFQHPVAAGSSGILTVRVKHPASIDLPPMTIRVKITR